MGTLAAQGLAICPYGPQLAVVVWPRGAVHSRFYSGALGDHQWRCGRHGRAKGQGDESRLTTGPCPLSGGG